MSPKKVASPFAAPSSRPLCPKLYVAIAVGRLTTLAIDSHRLKSPKETTMNREDFLQQSGQQSGLSRRQFLGGAVGVAAAAPLLGAAARLAADEPAAEKKLDEAETQDQARAGRLRRAGKLDRQALPETRRL